METLLQRISTWPVAWCLVVLSFLSSCQKEEAPDPKEIPSECRLTKYIFGLDSRQFTTFQYDSRNRILQSKMYVKRFDIDSVLFKYEYNSSGQLTKVIQKENTYNQNQEVVGQYFNVYTFEYNSKGQIAKYNITQPESTGTRMIYETVCEYDMEGNRTKTTTTLDNVPHSYINVYTYENSNCVSAIYNYGLSLERTAKFEYYLDKEDKQRSFNPSALLMYLTERTASKNLLKSETVTYKENNNGYGFQYSYDLNELGYPIKQHVIYPDQYDTRTGSNLIEYECQ